MKRTKILSGLFFLLTLIVGAANVSAQPKTVADYFMLLPQKHLNILKYYKNRRRAIETLDAKNGYLKVKEKVWDGETGEAEIALFRRKNGAAVIAVNQTNCGMDDCGGNLSLLIYDGVKWTDATEKLMREITDKIIIDAYNRIKTESDDALDAGAPPRIYFELPREGTTIRVALGGSTASSGAPLFYLKWNGEKFDFSDAR